MIKLFNTALNHMKLGFMELEVRPSVFDTPNESCKP